MKYTFHYPLCNIYAICMLFFLCLPGYAQTARHKINGKVLERTEKSATPLPSVSISLWQNDSTLINGTISDKKGAFRIDGVTEGDYTLKISFVGYETVSIAIRELKKDLEVGNIELSPITTELGEVTVVGNTIERKVDRMLVYPSKDAVKHSYDPYDLLSNMQIPNLRVNTFDKKLEANNGSVQIRINGVKASQEEFIAVPAKDIVRIEVIDNPGMKYGEGDMGTVVDVIVRRQETGGLVNVSNSFCPYRIMMFPNGSIKLNHKKSQWGFYYDGFLRDSKKAWTDKDEVFTLGDRTIHRIQEGQYGRNKVFMHNFSLTYNLYNPDDYTLNIAFRNALTNSPYGDINSKLYDAGSPDYILAQTKNDRQSYTPSLDIYFKKQFKHNQEFQANIVGTLINSESYRRYREYRDQVQLADIETDVDANKKSIWEKLFTARLLRTSC